MMDRGHGRRDRIQLVISVLIIHDSEWSPAWIGLHTGGGGRQRKKGDGVEGEVAGVQQLWRKI
jgi:hypothetical protein